MGFVYGRKPVTHEAVADVRRSDASRQRALVLIYTMNTYQAAVCLEGQECTLLSI